MPAVRVQTEGPVRVQNLPNRNGNVTADVYGISPERILYQDPKRAVATLIGNAAWTYSPSKTSTRAPIPANVPIVVTHCDEVWAAAVTGTVTVVAIMEMFAD